MLEMARIPISSEMQTLPTYTLVINLPELAHVPARPILLAKPCSVEGLRISFTDVIHSLIFKTSHARLDWEGRRLSTWIANGVIPSANKQTVLTLLSADVCGEGESALGGWFDTTERCVSSLSVPRGRGIAAGPEDVGGDEWPNGESAVRSGDRDAGCVFACKENGGKTTGGMESLQFNAACCWNKVEAWGRSELIGKLVVGEGGKSVLRESGGEKSGDAEWDDEEVSFSSPSSIFTRPNIPVSESSKSSSPPATR
jgi:hypothetical protein